MVNVSEAVLDPQSGPGTPLPNPFSNVSGQITVPGMGQVELPVNFNGAVVPAGAFTPFQHYSGSFGVDIGPVTRTVRLEGQLRGLEATTEPVNGSETPSRVVY
jgi:hypothetical protein